MSGAARGGAARGGGGEAVSLLRAAHVGGASPPPPRSSLAGGVASAASAAALALSQTRASIARNPRGFRVGVATVALVVGFSAVLRAGIASAPVLFLTLGEAQTGEADLILVPAAAADGAWPVPAGGLLNFTAMAPALGAAREVAGAAPRWAAPAALAAKGGARPGAPAASVTVVALALESAREAAIGLGRAWRRRALGEGEAYVTASALGALGVGAGVGDRVVATLSLLSLAGAAGGGGAIAALAAGGGSNATSPAAVDAALAALGLPTGPVYVDALTALALASNSAAGAPASPAATPASLVAANPALAALAGVTVDASPLLRAAVASALAATTLTAEFTVVDALDAPGGKWPALLGDVLVVEARWAAALLARAAGAAVAQLAPTLSALGLGGGPAAAAAAAAAAIDLPWLEARALTVHVMWARRAEQYVRNASRVGAAIVEFADAVASALGPGFPAAPATPLADVLSGLALLALFLEQVFNAVTFIMSLLGAAVVYALVTGDVDERAYELGMLRALGLRSRALAALLAAQVAAFTLPGVALGVAVAGALNAGAQAALGAYAALPLPLTLAPDALAAALALGVLVPAAAVVLPIRAALGGSLRDALDRSHTTINAVSIRLLRLAEAGLEPAQAAGAAVLVVVGFTTFYLLPLAFITGDLAIFLGVLTGVLMGMLLGLAAVAQALQPAAERGVLRALLAAGAGAGAAWRAARAPAAAAAGCRRAARRAAARAAAACGARAATRLGDGVVGGSGGSGGGVGGLGGVGGVGVGESGGGGAGGAGGGAVPAPPAASAVAAAEDVDGDADDDVGPGADGSWAADGRLFTVVAKSLEGHRGRNRKSAYMVGMSSAFIVFASTMFGLQAASLGDNVRMLLGADVTATVPEWLGAGAALPQAAVTALLTGPSRPAAVTGFTFVSAPLSGEPFIFSTAVSNLVALPRTRTRVYGVQSNLLAVAFAGYTQVAEASNAGVADGGQVDAGGGGGEDGAGAAATGAAAFDALAGGAFPPAAAASSLALGGGGVGGGGGAPDAFVDPVAAMVAGAGRLRLPIEATLTAPPPPLVTGDDGAPAYACARLVAAAPAVVAAVGAAGSNAGAGGDGAAAAAGAAAANLLASALPPSFTTADALSPSVAAAAASLANATAAAGGNLTTLLAWYSYDDCLLACNADVIAAAAPASPCAAPSSGAAARYGGPGTAAYAARSSPAPPSNASAPGRPPLDGAGAPDGRCGLPGACVTLGAFDAPAAAAGVQAAYTQYVDAVVSEALSPAAGISVATPLQARVRVVAPGTGGSALLVYMAKARALVRKLPGFLFSSYAPLAAASPVLVPMAAAARLLGDASAAAEAVAAGEPPPPPASVEPAARAPPWPALPAWLDAAGPQLGLSASGGNASAAGGGGGGGGAVAPFSVPAGAAPAASGLALLAALNASGVAGAVYTLPACIFVSGARLAPSPPSAARVPFQVYAASDAAASGWRRVARGVLPAAPPGAAASSSAVEVAFTATSARFWVVLAGPSVSSSPAAGGAPSSPPPPPPALLALRVAGRGAGAPCAGDALGGGGAEAFPRVPKHRLLVSLAASASPAERLRLVNALRAAIDSSVVTVQDTAALLAGTDVAVVGLQAFFNAVAALCLVLCFFATWLTFSANVRESAAELGVLRALGLSGADVTRACAYEALAVVLAALGAGVAIGLAIAVALTLQFNLFTELPFKLLLPGPLLALFALGVAALALGAAAAPAEALRRRPIAAVLKGA